MQRTRVVSPVKRSGGARHWPHYWKAAADVSHLYVRDAGFNYKYFDRSFAMMKEMWFPDRPPEMMEGHDLKKMIRTYLKIAHCC
jgi:hypothetical protein